MAPPLMIFDDTSLALRCRPGAIHPIRIGHSRWVALMSASGKSRHSKGLNGAEPDEGPKCAQLRSFRRLGRNDRYSPILLNNSVLLGRFRCREVCSFRPAMGNGPSPSCRRHSNGWTEGEHRQLAKVLGGCRERKFVLGTSGSTQSQSIQLQDALEVGEQHLDLFPVAT